MYRIAILDDYQNRSLQAAEWGSIANAEITVFNEFLGHDNRQIAESLMPFEVVVVMRERTRFPSELLCSLENLRLLVTAGMRNGAIDMLVARAQNIDVCGTEMRGYPAFEHTWALIMAAAKNIPQQMQNLQNGRWQQGLARGLFGQRLGLYGYGRIAKQVADYARAFNMQVEWWGSDRGRARAKADGRAVAESRAAFFAKNDIVSVLSLIHI